MLTTLTLHLVSSDRPVLGGIQDRSKKLNSTFFVKISHLTKVKANFSNSRESLTSKIPYSPAQSRVKWPGGVSPLYVVKSL